MMNSLHKRTVLFCIFLCSFGVLGWSMVAPAAHADDQRKTSQAAAKAKAPKYTVPRATLFKAPMKQVHTVAAPTKAVTTHKIGAKATHVNKVASKTAPKLVIPKGSESWKFTTEKPSRPHTLPPAPTVSRSIKEAPRENAVSSSLILHSQRNKTSQSTVAAPTRTVPTQTQRTVAGSTDTATPSSSYTRSQRATTASIDRAQTGNSSVRDERSLSGNPSAETRSTTSSSYTRPLGAAAATATTLRPQSGTSSITDDRPLPERAPQTLTNMSGESTLHGRPVSQNSSATDTSVAQEDTSASVPNTDRAKYLMSKVRPQLMSELRRSGFQDGAPIFIRIFKVPGTLEVWMKKNDRFSLFKTYRICSYSGFIGPKKFEGDSQSPEGFYTVSASQMKPDSVFHLAFDVGYPNAYDVAHDYTGGHIMVHGDCRSIGCFAMTDSRIEEIYALAYDALAHGQQEFSVHIFPFQLTNANLAKHASSHWNRFWRKLKVGYDAFEQTKKVPLVTVADGEYVVRGGVNNVIQPTVVKRNLLSRMFHWL